MPQRDLVEVLEVRAGLLSDLRTDVLPMLREESGGVHMLATIAPCYSESNSILLVPSRSSLLLNGAGMDNKEIRRANLLKLIEQHGGIAALADLVEVDPTYLGNIKNRVKTPSGRERGMGDDTAKRIEEKLKKPRGWMDTPQGSAADTDAQELLRDYNHATPAWQLTLRLLAKVSPDSQPELASALNKILAEGVFGAVSGNLDSRQPFYNSRLGDKTPRARSALQDKKDKKRRG